MKNLKIAILGVVSMLLMAFIVFIPMNAKAAKVTSGESIKLEKKGKQFYRFTLTEDALVQINWSKNSKKKAAIVIYADKEKTDVVYVVTRMESSGKKFIPLAGGMYYVDMYDNTATPTTVVKISWTLASTYAKDNYCVKNAQTLKADTLVHVVNTNDYNYSRWYKIKLTEPQKITIKTPYGGIGIFYIFDSKLREIENNCADNLDADIYDEFSSVEILPKGTYYIYCEIGYLSQDYRRGNYIAFKWQ